MQTWSDAELLREYAEKGSERAFAELVTRHTNLVYSAALRQVNSPDVAAEVAQRVFIALAQGAHGLCPRLAEKASLAGWLCRSSQNVSLNYRRDEYRRRTREGLAMENLDPASDTSLDWERVRAVLDDAMSELDESDYDAIVLRYFRNQDFRSLGVALGVSDDTAQKRVSRAIDKLRGHLTRRGVTTTATALSVALAANAIQAAPAGLSATICAAAALAHTAGAASTAIAVTKTIAMTTLQKTALFAAFAAVVGTGVYQARRASALEEQVAAFKTQNDTLTRSLQTERQESARKQVAAPRQSDSDSSNSLSDLMKLRAQVTALQNQLAAAQRSNQDPAAAVMTSWLQRVSKLKDKLAQTPDRYIPEFRLLTDKDWLDAVRGLDQLETDADYDKAWSSLRSAAKNDFSSAVHDAFQAYSQANNGALPPDFASLQTYFTKPMDDSILQGYDFSQPGTIVSKQGSLIDQSGNYYSSQMKIDPDGTSISTTGEDGLHAAIQSYLAANNGQSLNDPSQLLPYVNTPDEKKALQKILQNYTRNKP